jgi:hypothetical protein
MKEPSKIQYQTSHNQHQSDDDDSDSYDDEENELSIQSRDDFKNNQANPEEGTQSFFEERSATKQMDLHISKDSVNADEEDTLQRYDAKDHQHKNFDEDHQIRDDIDLPSDSSYKQRVEGVKSIKSSAEKNQSSGVGGFISNLKPQQIGGGDDLTDSVMSKPMHEFTNEKRIVSSGFHEFESKGMFARSNNPSGIKNINDEFDSYHHQLIKDINTDPHLMDITGSRLQGSEQCIQLKPVVANFNQNNIFRQHSPISSQGSPNINSQKQTVDVEKIRLEIYREAIQELTPKIRGELSNQVRAEVTS